MKVGFSSKQITPPIGVPMGGQPFPYYVSGVESNTYVRALYICDNTSALVIVSCDILLVTDDIVNEITRLAAISSGVSQDCIIMCATHTHSGPSIMPILGSEEDQSYKTEFIKRCVDTICEAVNNFSIGHLHFCSRRLPGYAFNRRFIMSDGTVQTHPIKEDPHIIKPEGPDANDLDVIWLMDESSLPIVSVVNFPCHPTVMRRNNTLVSSDYPGEIVKHISEKSGSDCAAMFLLGPSGNICQVDTLNSSHSEVGVEWKKKMGNEIASACINMIPNSITKGEGRLTCLSETILLARRKIDPDLLEWSHLQKEPQGSPGLQLSDYGVETLDNLSGKVSLENLFRTPFWAGFYADEIKTLSKALEYQPNIPFKITVVSQHNWALVAIPCELFAEWGNAIKSQSPFEFTMIATLANGWAGYVPTPHAFEKCGGYETKELTSTMLTPDAGAIIVENVLRMLNEISTPAKSLGSTL